MKSNPNDLATRLRALEGVDLRRAYRRQSGVLDHSHHPKNWAHQSVLSALGIETQQLRVRTLPAVQTYEGLVMSASVPLSPFVEQALNLQPYHRSLLPASLEKMALVIREKEDTGPRPKSRVLHALYFNLSQHDDLSRAIGLEYARLREHYHQTGEISSSMGSLIQARGKSGGRLPMYAFFARPKLILEIISRCDTAQSVNEAITREPFLEPTPRPSISELRGHLKEFLAEWSEPDFPNAQAFALEGKTQLFWQLRAALDMRQWAHEFGFGYRGGKTVWTGAYIESELDRFLAGHLVWPTTGEFQSTAEGKRLLKRVNMYGGPDFWARWMGVLPRHPHYGDIEQALRRFLLGKKVWPSRNEFGIAGLTFLYGKLADFGGVEHWQQHFGLDTSLWNEERILSTLKSLSKRYGQFPTISQMDEHARGLRYAVETSGGQEVWQPLLQTDLIPF